MRPTDIRCGNAGADVCLVLEGTYPYVRGGVSTWVHDLIGNLPDLRFELVHLAPEPGVHTRMRYSLAPNVVALSNLYCRERLARGPDAAARERAARVERRRHARAVRSSRVLDAIRRLHLDDTIDATLLDDLASGDLSMASFLHGRATFDLTQELYERLAPEASFLDFFWHVRSMHAPLVRLLGSAAPEAAMYHSLCTGYAGLLAAVWSHRTGRPFLLTEHGIYVRERILELDRWFPARRGGARPDRNRGASDGPTASALRRMWARFFLALARCAYARATAVVSLCESSRTRQISHGAPEERTHVVPNGIDLERFRAHVRRAPPRVVERSPLRVGFVGRVVPIKDVITFIRACFLAMQEVELDVRIIGSIDEDPAYTRRCRRLVARLGLERSIQFQGPRPIGHVYRELDLVVLTSFSEGQPLVILEANAAGIPVVASDVGACRELLEGRGGDDRRIGPSGIVTRLSAPEETAAAIVRLARDPGLRCGMGASGQRRVAAHYRESSTVSAYRTLYEENSWQASAGALSA